MYSDSGTHYPFSHYNREIVTFNSTCGNSLTEYKINAILTSVNYMYPQFYLPLSFPDRCFDNPHLFKWHDVT